MASETQTLMVNVLLFVHVSWIVIVLVVFNDMQLVSGVSGDMAVTRPGLVPRKTHGGSWRFVMFVQP